MTAGFPDKFCLPSLKAESCYEANFVVTGNITGCRYDHLRCPQLRQKSWLYGNSRFSVLYTIDSISLHPEPIQGVFKLREKPSMAFVHMSVHFIMNELSPNVPIYGSTYLHAKMCNAVDSRYIAAQQYDMELHASLCDGVSFVSSWEKYDSDGWYCAVLNRVTTRVNYITVWTSTGRNCVYYRLARWGRVSVFIELPSIW